MSEVHDAFADVKVEGTDPFKDIIVDPDKESTPAESQPAKVEESKEPIQGENTESKEDQAFHKRWREREDKLRADWNEQLEARLQAQREEFESKIPVSGDESVSIPKWFSRIHGNDPEAWEEYQEFDEKRRAEIKAELQEAQEAPKRELEQSERWVDAELARLEDQGHTFDRNELLRIVDQYKPTNDDGTSLDFDRALKILEIQKVRTVDPEKSQARKRIADVSSRSSTVGERKKDYMTSTEIRKKSWNDL